MPPTELVSEPRVQAPVRIAATDAHEGPVYLEDALLFTTVRRERVAIKRLSLADGSVSVLVPDANNANGMALHRGGRVLVCEQGSRAQPARLTRLDPATGERETLVAEVEGRPLNSPNDVVAAADGAVWFTDPSYGWLQGFRPKPSLPDRVYRVGRDGRAEPVADSLDKPNGLALSPDGRVLYVGDSGAIHGPDDYDARRPRRVLAFDVVPGGLANERVLVDDVPGFPDGLATDDAGRVYVSCATGIRIVSSDGEPLAEVPLAGAVNFTFAGRRRDVLLVTADTAVWAVVVDLDLTKGAPR